MKDPFAAAGVAIFIAACTVGVGSWFFGIVEFVGMSRFWPWVYRAGLKILDEPVLSRPVLSSLPDQIDLPSVRGRRESGERVFFRAPFRWFSFRIHTPFPIKGTLSVSGSTSRIVGRIPIGTAIFFAAWLVGWTAGGFMAVNTSANISATLFVAFGFVAFGWAFAAALITISLPIELHRIRKARDALLLHLDKAAA